MSGRRGSCCSAGLGERERGGMLFMLFMGGWGERGRMLGLGEMGRGPLLLGGAGERALMGRPLLVCIRAGLRARGGPWCI